MKKTIFGVALLTVGVFGAGYTIGQIGGGAGSSAAAAVVTPTVTATSHADGGPGGGAMDAPHADGTVTAINGDTLTISAGTDPTNTTEYTGVTTVLLTPSTQYDMGHDSTTAAGKPSIKVGSYVIVNGAVSSDGKTITASSLGINAGGPVPGR